MKRLLYTILLAILVVPMLNSCLGDSVEDEYKDWRETNEAWYNAQAASGNYTRVNATWDPSAQVLMHWHNDTMLTRGNLKPYITSTTDVKYKLSLYDGTPVDSSYALTSPADSIYRSSVNANIEGWMIALTRMHVGDSCTVIIPYPQGYGSTQMSNNLLPYSMLVFDVKLVDIYKYMAN